MSATSRPVRTILFVSLSCVGDAVMTTPVLESLHHRFPEAVIDIVADKRSAILYAHCPYLGKVLLKDKKKFLRGAPALLAETRKTVYDIIVDLRTDGLAYLCRGHQRFTKWNRKAYGPHAVEQLMGVIHAVHGEQPLPPARVWLSEAETRYADTELAGLPAGRWLAFAPAVAFASKAWPTENYVKLANAVADIFSGVILDGSPREREITDAVARGLNLPCVNLAGRTSLLQAAAVLARASLFVGSDSGLGHVASAVSTPTLTLFSNDTPTRVLPWGNRADYVCAVDGNARSIRVEHVEKKVRGFF